MKARVTFTLLFAVFGALLAGFFLYFLGLVIRAVFFSLNFLAKLFLDQTSSLSPSPDTVEILGSGFIIVFFSVVLIAAYYGYRYGVRVTDLRKWRREDLNLILTVIFFSLPVFIITGHAFLSTSLRAKEYACAKVEDTTYVRGTNIVGIRDSLVDTGQDGITDHLKIILSVDTVCRGEFTLYASIYSEEAYLLRKLKKTTWLEKGRGEVIFNLDLEQWLDILAPESIFLKEISLKGEYLSPLTGRVEETIVADYGQYEISATLEIEGLADLLEVYNINDYGLDADGNGFFEGFVVELQGKSHVDGEFLVQFRLENGLVSKERDLSLARGDMHIVFHLDGASIYKKQLDGPYSVGDLSFQSKSNKNIGFVITPLVGYETKAYSYRQFE